MAVDLREMIEIFDDKYLHREYIGEVVLVLVASSSSSSSSNSNITSITITIAITIENVNGQPP